MVTTNDFCKKEYGSKLYKISFDAGFTCPNRDGTCGDKGCIFCSSGGSGDFAVKLNDGDIDLQIEKAKGKVASKYKGDKYIAYFQAFTNTYADVETLEKIYMPIINRDDIAVLSIATRPDCLSEDVYELLKRLNRIKPVWVELGLQTTKRKSIDYIRRGYAGRMYDLAVKKLNKIGIHTITHIILYLPGENEEDMLKTVRHAVKCGTKGIKLQLLHILKGTDLADDYKESPFYVPTMDEYVHMIKKCISECPEDMVFHRLTGDPPKRLLIEPKWAADKKKVINALNNEINPPSPYYVYMLECGDGSYYTGSTNDVIHRFRMHSTGRGCKYTSSHQPVKLIYVERLNGKSAALSREYAIKQLTKSDKISLLKSDNNIVNDFTCV